MRKILLLITKITITVFCVLPLSIFAQDNWHLLPEKPGKWTYTYHNEPYGPNAEKNYKLTLAELTAIKQKLAQLAEILHQNQEVANPVGFDAVAEGSFYCSHVTAPPPSFTQAEINLKFYSLWGDNSGNIKKYGGEAPAIDLYINNSRPSDRQYLNYRETGNAKDVDFNNSVKKLNELFIRPEIVKEIAPGITAYADGTIVIAKPGKPYWTPITFQEWFDLQLEFAQQDMIKMNVDPKDAEATPNTFLKKDKSAFSAELLKTNSEYLPKLMQAHPDLDIPKLSGVTQPFIPYLRLNPEYFDKSLQKTAIRIIILHANTSVFQDGNNCSRDDAAQTACCKFAGSIDYEALQKLLETN
jgi:hypothetical protein